MVSRKQIDHFATAEGLNLLVLDGFEDAFVGWTARDDQPPVAVYDYDAMVEVLCKRDGMTVEEAVEYIAYNVERAVLYEGELQPLFLRRFRPEVWQD